MGDKKIYSIVVGVGIVLIALFLLVINKNKLQDIAGNVVEVNDRYFIVDSEDGKYKFAYLDERDITEKSNIEIKYKGKLNEKKINKMKSYTIVKETVSIIDQLESNGIFSAYYDLAKEKLDKLTVDEKIGQVLLARVPEGDATEAVKKYKFGGYVLFERDFKDKTKEEINTEIKTYQDVSDIPMIMATDEEGGKVVRASSNTKLRSTPFLSSQDLYKKGSFDLIREDTLDKSKFLKDLGINVNLAPVVDVVTDTTAYMYNRSFGQNTELTSKYAETVIKASKTDDVSYVLKHFPGYSNNSDTHSGSSVDGRTLEEIKETDLPPFKAGIDAMAEAVLVSHNIVDSIEKDTPASLSKNVHEMLRQELNFSGIVITDDLDMLATKNSQDVYLNALKAGNDMLIVTDYDAAFDEVKAAINDNILDPDVLDKAALRVIAWKYHKVLFPNKG
ncbi:MAG: beta-hexosaminidase [Bacilli bacterium]|nr:beta-hexosaminidase [Bacilli bacterium]